MMARGAGLRNPALSGGGNKLLTGSDDVNG